MVLHVSRLRAHPIGNIVKQFKKFFLFVVAVLFVAGIFWVSLYLTRDSEGEGEGNRWQDEAVRVEVARVEVRDLTERATYSGSVVANETVSIVPMLSGLVRRIHFQMGDRVWKGDLLVEIDDAEYVERLKQDQANLRLSKAQHRRARTFYELSEKELDRIQAAVEEGLSTTQELDTALAQRDSSHAQMEVEAAEVSRMQAVVDEAELNLENTRILSPLDGNVQRRHVDPGALASSSSPLLTIVNTDPAEVVVFVPENDLFLAEVGRDALVTLRDGSESFVGRVSRVAPALSVSTRTTEIVIDIPNEDGRLRPGMSAEVSIVARQARNALAVPDVALMFPAGHAAVYRVIDGMAYTTPVKIGIEDESYTEILDGLSEGDTVVINGQFMLRDGQEVIFGNSNEGGPVRPLSGNTD